MRPLATFTALAVYMIINREKSFEKAFEHGLKATRKIALIFFILMFAYGVAECFMATGVGASLILLALKLGITARTVAIVSLLVTCVLSIATGSSWGTFAACAPIFLWLNHLVGGDVMLTLCAIAGGSCFGDNIGMISDVTVLSCGMQDVKIIDRIKHQMAWCFGCLAIALVIFYFAGSHLPNVQGDVQAALDSIPPEAYAALEERRPSAVLLLEQVKTGVPYYMVIPMLLVIVLSFLGLHTLICLGAGMFSSLVLGYFAGTANLHIWLNDLLYGGFSGAGEWVIVMMMWVSAFGGIMNAMNAFEPLSRLVVRISRNVHQLMGWCGVLCLMGNMALADEAAQVATMSPIVRDIVEKNVETDSEEDAYQAAAAAGHLHLLHGHLRLPADPLALLPGVLRRHRHGGLPHPLLQPHGHHRQELSGLSDRGHRPAADLHRLGPLRPGLRPAEERAFGYFFSFCLPSKCRGRPLFPLNPRA